MISIDIIQAKYESLSGPQPGQCAAAVSVMSDTAGPGRGFNSPHAFQQADSTFPTKLEKLIAPLTREDADSPLVSWPCKSARQLTDESARHGTKGGRQAAMRELPNLETSRAIVRPKRAISAPPTTAGFGVEHINIPAERSLKKGAPAISADTGKKVME